MAFSENVLIPLKKLEHYLKVKIYMFLIFHGSFKANW